MDELNTAAGLEKEIGGCRLCASRFLLTATSHVPRPIVWFRRGTRILVAGQAPGARVHASGRPFDDMSGQRLRRWMGLETTTFWDRSRISIVPMSFCFPGYSEKGADLPPPGVCARTWRLRVMDVVEPVPLTVLVGGAAIRWHLGLHNVTEAVAGWRWRGVGVFALPHPSWRNTGWLRRNPWFEAETVPALQDAVRRVMNDAS